MKFISMFLVALLVAPPVMAQTSAPARFLATAPDETPVKPEAPTSAPPAFIQLKQAAYGPFWGKYRTLQAGMSSYCGDESSFCEVYCPKNHKTCFVVYSCGEHVTKSLETRSGEMIVMDCRASALGLPH